MKIEEIHDFAGKLNQPEARESVRSYIDFFKKDANEPRTFSNLFSSPSDKLFTPLSINLDLTVACNYRCPHCIDEAILNTKNRISEDVIIKSLINLRIAGLKTVILIGGGEPTIHPKFANILRTIKSLGLNCAIVTNGSRNNKILEIANHFTKKDWIRISLDAGSEKTFQHLHKPINQITLEEICANAHKIKTKNSELQLGFSFIVISPEAVKLDRRLIDNYKEIVLATELAKKNGFDYISFKPYLYRDLEGRETIPYLQDIQNTEAQKEIKKQLTEAIKLIDDKFKVIESINLLEIISNKYSKISNLQPPRCHMQTFRQVLTPTGIYACPAYRGNSLSRISNSNGYSSIESFIETSKKTYLQVLKFNAAQECRNINCIYNSTNWWIESGIKNDTLEEVSLQSNESQAIFL